LISLEQKPSFHDLLAQQPGMVFYKDHHHIYTAASDYTAKLCGFPNARAFQGCNDYELRCPAIQSAEEFRAEDRRVFESGTVLTCLQLHQYADQHTHIFMLKKSPVRNADGELIGVCGFGSEVINPEVGKVLFKLMVTKTRHKSSEPMCALEVTDLYEQLSMRESQVLYFFMRGFTNKEIGLYMTLSARTVETYIERIKIKFNCITRSELQDCCLQKGLIYSIPKSIFGACLNQSIAW
jgi:DNA-binding CsgD family transcriptional regulator